MAVGCCRREAHVMTVTASAAAQALRGTRVLLGAYLVLSVLTMVAIVVFRDDASMVTDTVWVRCTIVLVSALLTVLFARSAARGSRRGFLRLRIVTAVMVVAIAVIVALPGFLPVWVRVEQGVCGVVLLAVVVVTNGRRVRSVFTR
jgi:O-antigen/teichoic acid export membrane protein